MSIVHVWHPPKEWEGWESHIVHFHTFSSMPSGMGEIVGSPEFRSFGHEWRVIIYPGGDEIAEEGLSFSSVAIAFILILLAAAA